MSERRAPADGPLSRRAARELVRTGRIGRLRALADAGHPQGCRQLAASLVRTGGLDELRQRMADGDRFARRAYADWLVGRRRIDEAIECLRPLADGGVEGAVLRLARLLAGRGRIEEALAVADRLDERRVPIIGWLGSQGRHDLLWKRVAGGDSRARSELSRRACELWRSGRLPPAVALLAGGAADGDVVARLVGIARHDWRAGRLRCRDEAIELLAAVDDPMCRRTRAHLLTLQGRQDEALAELKSLAAAGDRAARDDLLTLSARRRPVRELRVLDHVRGAHLCDVAFHPDGRTLATCSRQTPAAVVLFDPSTGEHRGTMHSDAAMDGACFSPDGTVLADSSGRLWDHARCAVLRHLTSPGPERQLRGVAFQPGGPLFAARTERHVQLWDWRTAAHLQTLDVTAPPSDTRVRAIAFSPDGTLLAAAAGHWPPAGYPRNVVRLWEAGTGELRGEIVIERMSTISASINAVAFSPDSSLLAVTTDRRTELWDPKTSSIVRTLGGQGRWDSGGHAVAFHPGGRLLVTAQDHGWANSGVRLWNPGTGEPVDDLGTDANAVAFSPDGALLAAASEAHGAVRLWPVRVG